MDVQRIRDEFVAKYKLGEFSVDRTGVKTLEILGASFVANEPTIFGAVNESYIQAELDWYESRSTNVNDLKTASGQVPPAWVRTATKHGEINSNYGHLIRSPLYYDQYSNVLRELTRNRDSRRATMVYTRPSIWVEFDFGGRSDFICTNAVAYYVRHRSGSPKLDAVVQMRSNDAWAGYRNDYAWQSYVLQQLVTDYNAVREEDADVSPGDIYWQAANLHMYSYNFWMIDSYIKYGRVLKKSEYEAIVGTPSV